MVRLRWAETWGELLPVRLLQTEIWHLFAGSVHFFAVRQPKAGSHVYTLQGSFPVQLRGRSVQFPLVKLQKEY